MMKKIYNSFHLLAVLALLLSSAVVSCNRDEMRVDEGDGTIQVSLQGVETRAGELTLDGETIGKLRVIVCAGNAVEVSKLFIAGEDDFINPFQLIVTIGVKTVYVVANETAALTSQLNSVVSKSALDALLTEEITAPMPSTMTSPFVMTGKTDDGGVKVQIGTNYTKVSLKRAAARIRLQFNKETDKEVIITKVSLLSNTGKMPLFEGTSVVANQSYWNYEYPVTGGIELADTLINISDDYVYVYENLAEKDVDGNPIKTNAVRLEVEALYDNTPTTYRVYINENVTVPANPGDPQSSVTTPDDHLYSIKRNYSYEFTGTIQNMGEVDGLILRTSVLPWSRLTSEVSYELEYEIFPTIYEDDIFELENPSDYQRFSFTLFMPLFTSWKAHLTNPFAFGFLIGLDPTDPDDDYKYVDSGVSGVEVTMLIKPNQVQDNIERRTEFYITVNGMELPLISGSNKIGPGNRPVIIQPSK